MFAPPVSALAAGAGPAPISRGSSLTPLDGLRPIPADGSFGGGVVQSPGTRGRTGSANTRPSPLASSGRIPTAGTITVQATNLSEADNIKVAVRVRPLFPHETEKGGTTVVQVNSNTTIKVVVPGPAGTSMQRDFAFHACLGPEVSQADVLHLCGVPQLLDAALAGYNVTVFAYGQTGSGKTYTMSGREEVISSDSYSGDMHDGIITRAIQHLFAAIEAKKADAKYAISASYLEIYNEGIFDLLNLKAKNLPVKWDATLGFFVPGLKQVACTKIDTMMEVIRTGMKHRHVGSHELNIESSRSHSIMTIFVHATPTDPQAADFGTPRIGKISFVDLAGSERLKDTKSEGAMLKETTNINKSLFVLGKVISALAERDSSGTSAHIPYRDSKLTKLLMDSLGGNALALMIACCSPASTAVEETLSTLSYATRAKNIQNRPTVQYDPKEAQIANLRREIELLRQENSYLREQLRIGGAVVISDIGTPLQNTRPAWPPGSAGSIGVAGPSGGSGDASGIGVSSSFSANHAPWSSILSNHNHGHDNGAGGSRDSSRDSARDGVPVPGGGLGHLPPPARLGNARVGMSAEGGGLRASSGSSSPAHLEPLRMSVDASASGGGAGGAGGGGPGTPLGRRASHAGLADDNDLMRRLMETQNLLARFSEENGRLAKENDRLRAGRQLLSQEHGEVLDEIETLRSKLIQLESAVLSGAQTPNAAKAALHSAMANSAAGRGDSAGSVGIGSASGSRTPPLVRQNSGGGGGGGGGHVSPPLSAGGALPFGSAPSYPHPHPHPAPGTPGYGQPWPPMPGGFPYQAPPPGMPGSAAGYPPGSAHPPVGYGMPVHTPMQPAPQGYGPAPGSAAMPQHPNHGGQPQPSQPPGSGGGVANVMAVGGGPGNTNAMRTRAKYASNGGATGGGGGGGGDDSIIVADRNKLALLLGDGPVEPAVPVRPVPVKPSEPSYANAAKVRGRGGAAASGH